MAILFPRSIRLMKAVERPKIMNQVKYEKLP